MTNHDDLHADDLQGVIDELRAHRPEATALELDGIKQRVRGRVAARPSGRRARSADLMKSRLAILATLVLGMVLSTTGAGLAISGMSGSGDAGVAQYGPTPTPPPAPTPPPTQPAQPVTPPAQPTPAPESGAVLGETEAAQPAPEEKAAPKTQAKPKPAQAAPAPAAAQPTRQVEAGAGNELPFTGFAAIPILLGGIALLATGLVMRRRSSQDS
jgi:hypothetical protein